MAAAPDSFAVLIGALRGEADLTEKALAFMGDPEQAADAEADVATWRAAADALEALTEAAREVAARFRETTVFHRPLADAISKLILTLDKEGEA